MKRTLLALVSVVLCSGCAAFGGRRVSADIVALTQDTKPGGEVAFELAADGTIIGIDVEIDPSDVPQVCREAADRHFPGGRVIGAEKEWNEGRRYWEIVKEIDGKRFEILMNADGSLAGHEEALRPDEVPDHVLAVAMAAVPHGRFVVAERVSGPEAKDGEEYHVKIDVGGEQARVGVGGSEVVRVVRKMHADFRVPRR